MSTTIFPVRASCTARSVRHALLLHKPNGQNYVFVIQLMARDVAFLGRASSSALRTSVVNTALSYGFVNCSSIDVTAAG
jgi:hypothetical protein